MSSKPKNVSTFKEELGNSLSHGLGFLLSIAGLVLLVVFAAKRGDAWHVVGSAIFGSTLILLYLASTLYHSLPDHGPYRIFRRLDHSAIYLLIAGTYTPFTLATLRGGWGWSLFGVVWGLAILGLVKEFLMKGRHWISLVLYLLMGWAIVVAGKPLLANLPQGGLVLLGLGGVAYTGGVAFYVWRKLPFHHVIWHGFVLAGSILHFFAVLLYVIPSGA